MKDIENIHDKESVNKVTIPKQSHLIADSSPYEVTENKKIPQMIWHGVSAFFVIQNLKVKLLQ